MIQFLLFPLISYRTVFIISFSSRYTPGQSDVSGEGVPLGAVVSDGHMQRRVRVQDGLEADMGQNEQQAATEEGCDEASCVTWKAETADG